MFNNLGICWRHSWFAGLLLLTALNASAESLHWQDNSLSVLAGNGFEVDSERQLTLTVEHASGWSWGDVFAFLDVTHFRNSRQQEGLYGEFSPRLSLSKLAGKSLGMGPVQDMLLAATYEFGRGDVESLLVGPGFDLDIPGFDFFQLNLYRRIPGGNRDGESFQLTPVWSVTTPVAGSELIFDGFVDWNVVDDKSYADNIHVNTQLKYDLSRRLGLGRKKVLVGIEYSYWKNKYGIRDSAAFDTDQSVVSLLLKSHF